MWQIRRVLSSPHWSTSSWVHGVNGGETAKNIMSCKSAKEITQLIETILDREWSKENDEGGNVITHNKDIFFSASPSPASPSSSSSSTSWWWFNYEEIGQRDSKHLREHGMVEEHIPTHIHTHVLYLYIVSSLSLPLSANERSSVVVVAASPPRRRRHYCCSFLFFRMHFGALPSKKYAPVCTSSMWPFVRWLCTKIKFHKWLQICKLNDSAINTLNGPMTLIANELIMLIRCILAWHDKGG